MNRNSFLRQAMEQYGEQSTADADEVTAVAAPDDASEVDTAQALSQARIENEELSDELVETQTENEEIITATAADEIDSIEAAVESLNILGKVVASSIASGHYNQYTNAGYAMALESICSAVHLPGASLSAAMEANEIATYDPNVNSGSPEKAAQAEEKAKSQGIFNTIREKIKQIWKALVTMAKGVVSRIQNVGLAVQFQNQIHSLEGNLEKVTSIAQSNFKGKIKDEKFIKTVKVLKNTTINKLMLNTSTILDNAMNYAVAYENLSGDILRSMDKADNAMQREKIQSNVWSLSDQLITAIGKKGANAPEVKSDPLIGGLVLTVKREKRENGIPKIDLSHEFVTGEMATEVDTMGTIDLNFIGAVLKTIQQHSKEGSPLQGVKEAVQKLSEQAPSRWTNLDKIDDVQQYATAAIGYVAKHAAQLNQIIFGLIHVRYVWTLARWAKLTIDAHHEHENAPAAGEGGNAQASAKQAATAAA